MNRARATVKPYGEREQREEVHGVQHPLHRAGAVRAVEHVGDVLEPRLVLGPLLGGGHAGAADVDHLVGDGGRERRVVAGHQHRRAGVAARPHQVTDHGASVGVEPLLGLVEDEQPRRSEPGERQPEQLPLAGRQLVGEALAHRAETEGVEGQADPLHAGVRVSRPHVASTRVRWSARVRSR